MKTEVFRCGCRVTDSFLNGKTWTRCPQHSGRGIEDHDDDFDLTAGLVLGQAFGNPGLGVTACSAVEHVDDSPGLTPGGGGEGGGEAAGE